MKKSCRYFSPLSSRTVTMVLSSGKRSRSWRAARRCAPELGPQNRPRVRASLRISATASSLATLTVFWPTRSRWRWKMPGTKPSEMPSIWCRATSPHRMVRDSEGSIANRRTFGLTARRAWPTPIRVPPVPTPCTKASGRRPSGSWRRISWPSHSRFSSTFHSFSNWPGKKKPGCRPSSRARSSASLTWKLPQNSTSAP